MDDDKPRRKPPAFQVYVRDFLASDTVASMPREDVGMYFLLLLAAWNSDQPGCLPEPLEVTAKMCRTYAKDVRKFLERYPTTFPKESRFFPERYANPALCRQYASLEELSIKRQNAANARYANAAHLHQSSSSTAFASATASKNIKHTHAFVKPTYEQVLTEMLARNIPNPQTLARQYVDHYESNGWKVGRNPMRSWKHAVTTWQVNQHSNGGNGNGQSKAEEREARSNRAIYEAGRKIAARNGWTGTDESGVWDGPDGKPITDLH